ncbi:PAP2 superfamily-domain-containing protein [Zopfochytrium polystomum]|nr:PAP2 superfamily-domain-containing protein [Zopfochytrium polystomum]
MSIDSSYAVGALSSRLKQAEEDHKESASLSYPTSAREKIRTIILSQIHSQSLVIANLQARFSSRAIGLFASLGLLGNHGAYMLLLPPLFWFDSGIVVGGEDAMRVFGRGLVILLGLGVFWTSFVKDWLCVPRPLSPPVKRTSLLHSTALEYGFPSTHTANAVSAAAHVIFFLHFLYLPYVEAHHAAWSTVTVVFAYGACLSYAFLMGFSRIVTGMHSFTDVVGAAAMGLYLATVWWILGAGRLLEAWMFSPGSSAPVMAVLAGLAALKFHPEPEGPCPCFEDTVAFVSVMSGVVVGCWLHGPGSPKASPTSPIMAVARLAVGVATLYGFRKSVKITLRPLITDLFSARSTLCKVLGGNSNGNKLEDNCNNSEEFLSTYSLQGSSNSPASPSRYRIPRLTARIVLDIITYFFIAVGAVHVLPLLFQKFL